MDARTQAWLDQEDAQIREAIRTFGWWITYVGGGVCSHPDCDGGEDEGPPFGYTTGIFGLGHPELVVVGLDMTRSANLLNTMAARIKSGDQLIPGMELTIDEWPEHKLLPEEVPNPGEIVFEANRFYQRPAKASVPALQLTYCNARGLYPWDVDYPRPVVQPRPGSWRA